jgi:hypothetical protein
MGARYNQLRGGYENASNDLIIGEPPMPLQGGRISHAKTKDQDEMRSVISQARSMLSESKINGSIAYQVS